jgi:1-acyl-sn-glycerol-3-phosphate acyltransferase
LFYIKIVLVGLWFIITSTIALLVGIIRWKHPSGGYVFSALFTKGAALITGVNVQIKNKERLLECQPCVYVGNHQSNLDMVTQAHCYPPRTVCIGKKELFWIPFFGALFYFTGNIFLDRKNHRKAIGGMVEAQEQIKKRKLSVYMFPEGTRNLYAKELLPFKKGAFNLAIGAQVPIVPVICAPVKNFIDLEAKIIRPGIVHIEVLEPISTLGKTDQDAAELAHFTRARMQEAFDRLSKI